MEEYLFSYGTLQKEEVQLDLFGRTLTGTDDALTGYRTATIEITDTAFLSKGEQKFQQTAINSKDNNDVIKGTAFELTSDELLVADKYEPEGYTRIKVVLDSGKQAWLYIHSATAR